MFDLPVIREYILKSSLESKIYLGCDSQRYRSKDRWLADYATVIVIHKDGKHGCKIFGQITTLKDYDQKKGSPKLRLMNECYLVSEIYLLLADILHDRNVEIHLDINPSVKFASNDVVQEAIGFIKGTCDITPKIKPEAVASSCAGDKFLIGL